MKLNCQHKNELGFYSWNLTVEIEEDGQIASKGVMVFNFHKHILN